MTESTHKFHCIQPLLSWTFAHSQRSRRPITTDHYDILEPPSEKNETQVLPTRAASVELKTPKGTKDFIGR